MKKVETCIWRAGIKSLYRYLPFRTGQYWVGRWTSPNQGKREKDCFEGQNFRSSR